jgi:hypothetical protein
MEANTRVVASHLTLIQDPEEIEAAKNDQLYLDSKKVLIIKGIPAAQAVATIYKEFSVRKDPTGNPFRLSHAAKGIMHRDQWGEDNKVGIQDFKRYIEHWFTLTELTTYDNKPALVVVKSLPIMMVPTYCQGRFVSPEMLSPFEMDGLNATIRPHVRGESYFHSAETAP